MKLSDFQLVTRAQKGNMEAFEQLISRYDQTVMNIATSFRNDLEDAKDIYQEVFMRVFKGLKKFKLKSEFSTWLYKIAVNVCISHKRKKAKYLHDSLEREIRINEEETVRISDMIAGDERTDESAIRSDLNKHINNAIEKLPNKQRMAFILKYYEGYKIREISEMMRCTEGTVKRYLFTAVKKMRTNLEPIINH
ncbi:RNA polymerase sigma factor [Bacteroidota bacterium]